MNDSLASGLHQDPGTSAEPTDVSRRNYSLTTLRSIIAAWEARKRFRWELDRMSRDNPHLIDDIGLTARQVEAEIVKPFWQE
ncbi:DUF1127 domain-containing protein [Mesorhizobium sp. INR15]|uniref:DUF1127 domain-containing protein n=1 Tax=Mesorhizobium sp. INR15 TaxID=2654248 RepID=UPI0018C01657|nr:DUF1127 domain-containing protein [Mesorhizobium sp. INR15]QPC93132.1 DUF1127 domain-containing protein [Mesorhizobium sp. INR15]